MMGWSNNGWGMGTSGTLGTVLMVALLVGLMALAAWGITRATRSQPFGAQVVETPRAILDRRLASGDIDAEAYAQARRILEAPAPTGR